MTAASEMAGTNGARPVEGSISANGIHSTNGWTAPNDVHVQPVDAAIERDRLALELEAARLRLADARARALAREAASIEALRDAVAASRISLAQLEREHDEALQQLQAATAAEVEQVLDEAKRLAANLRSGDSGADHAVHDVE